MSQSANVINLSNNQAQSLAARVQAHSALWASHAADNEAAGKLCAHSEQALREANLFGLFVPEEYGGDNLMPMAALELLAGLFMADASTAWVTMATNISASVASNMQAQAARELFTSPWPVCAGQGAPNGRAQVTEGGYLLSGAWSYGSGIRNADYAVTGAVVLENGQPRKKPNGAHDVRLFVVPINQVTLLGNWDVIGLKGTGSVDYRIDNVFVPEAMAIDASSAPQAGGAAALIGLNGRVLIAHTSFAMGVARRLLDEIAALGVAKGSRGCLADTELFRAGYARAESQYRAAHAWVLSCWQQVEDSLLRGEAMSTRQITLCRLALIHMTEVMLEVAQFCYRSGGGSALRDGALQRYYRDAQAGAQHIQASHAYLSDCAKDLLGRAAQHQWTLFALVAAPQS